VHIDWESPSCLLCAGSNRVPSDAVEWWGATFTYVLCGTCGLKYMCPRPTQRWYRAFYEREFWQEKVEYTGFTSNRLAPRLREEGLAKRLAKQHWRAQRIIRLAARRIRLDASSFVLDVGAAFGVTLDRFREKYGCRVAGVEPSTIARNYAEHDLGIPLAGRYVEDLFAPTAIDGEVSLIIFSHVLENVIDPAAALSAVHRLLRPGGHVYIDTSNFVYYNAINPYHPYIFSPDTLEALLGACGLVVIDREHEPPPMEAVAPSNRYLMFLAAPGVSTFVPRRRSVDEIVAEQRLGLEKHLSARRRRSSASEELDTG
jgi:SAM-dependent methyltransferase